MVANPRDTEHGTFALEFAGQLCSLDFRSAHRLLSRDMQQQCSEEQLKARFEDMIEYGGGITAPGIVETLESWPDKMPGDLGWAYVGISGRGFNEAVTVVVCVEQGSKAIRSIIWGRP